MANLRPSTAGDVEALYGAMLPVTVHGLTAVDGDEVLGMGAIYPQDGCMVLICSISPAARRHLKRHARLLLIAARRLLAMAARRHLPVRAVADSKQPRAIALLEHLGFRHIEKDVYEWTTPA